MISINNTPAVVFCMLNLVTKYSTVDRYAGQHEYIHNQNLSLQLLLDLDNKCIRPTLHVVDECPAIVHDHTVRLIFFK